MCPNTLTNTMVGPTWLLDKLDSVGGIGTKERLLMAGSGNGDIESSNEVILRGIVRVGKGNVEIGWKTIWNDEEEVLLQYLAIQ